MRPIIGHIVTAERQHRERIAANAAGTFGRGRFFGSHRRGQINAVTPVERLVDQRRVMSQTAAEDERADGHAFGVFPVRINRRALARRSGETGVRMSRRRFRSGRPVVTLPIDQVGGFFFRHSFPPHVAVVRQGDVRKDRVRTAGLHGVVVRMFRRSRSDAEETGFGIDGVQTAVLPRFQPRDVIADRPNFPSLESGGGNQHGQIRFAACAGESGGDISFFTFGAFDSGDQHMFGQPSFIASLNGGDAQSQTFLTQQGVAAVTGTERPDFTRFGEVRDIGVVGVARPCNVLNAVNQRHADGMHAGDERTVFAQNVQNLLPRARHNGHIDDDVRGIGDFNADFRNMRTQRPHRERNDVHCAAAHAPFEQTVQFFFHFLGIRPVVRRTGVDFAFRADERAGFDACHVGRVRPRQIAVRAFLFVQFDERALFDQQRA